MDEQRPTLDLDVEMVRGTLARERSMRLRGLSGPTQERKVLEIDTALESLGRIESRLREVCPEEFQPQSKLFEE